MAAGSSARTATIASRTAAPERSPPRTRAAPASSARRSTGAAARPDGVSLALREDIARPSGSRTVSHGTTSVGSARSRAIRAITRTCW